jgi:hypothetical protein
MGKHDPPFVEYASGDAVASKKVEDDVESQGGGGKILKTGWRKDGENRQFAFA